MNKLFPGFEGSQNGGHVTSVVLRISLNSWVLRSSIRPSRSAALSGLQAAAGTQESGWSMGPGYQSGITRKAETRPSFSMKRDLILTLLHRWWKTEKLIRIAGWPQLLTTKITTMPSVTKSKGIWGVWGPRSPEGVQQGWFLNLWKGVPLLLVSLKWWGWSWSHKKKVEAEANCYSWGHADKTKKKKKKR